VKATVAAADFLIIEAQRLLEEAHVLDLPLRASGGIGIRLRSPGEELFRRLGRDAFNDIDLIGASSHRRECLAFLTAHEYEVDRDLLLSADGRRYLFSRENPEGKIDLFMDRLEMCHTLELRSRLDIHRYTIPLADLLLQKLQIVDITHKDIVDICALLLTHDFGDSGDEVIDSHYIATLLGGDWGFWYTTTLNIEKLLGLLSGLSLSDEERATLSAKLHGLSEMLEAAPKSRKWRWRARIGPKAKWYETVEEDPTAF
jgi:hypothetical protein